MNALRWTPVVLASLLAGCYSDAWIAELDAGNADGGTGETGDTGDDTGPMGDCTSGDLQCSDTGVFACIEGAWQPDRSNLGCAFAAGTLPQSDTDNPAVNVGFANSGMRAANVTLRVDGTTVGTVQVPPQGAAQLPLPWNPALGQPGSSAVVPGGTVAIETDEPVAAFMFNRGNPDAASSDASLLLPRHVWGDDYYALTNPHFVSPFNADQGPAFWAALGSEPVELSVSGGPATQLAAGTVFDPAGDASLSLASGAAAVAVTVSSGTSTSSCGWSPAFNYYACGRPPLADPMGAPRACAATPMEGSGCGGAADFIGCCGADGAAYFCSDPNAGVWTRESCPPLADGSDLSGSRVTGDAPFAMFAGHGCANIPAYELFCDHLEEQLWPVAKAGRVFPVLAPSFDGSPHSYLLRVLAVEGPVQLAYRPMVPQAPTSIPGAGQYVEFWVSSDVINPANFILDASGPVEVVQISLGEEGGFGDPAMLLTPAITQGRTDMPFFVPNGFTSIAVTVVGPTGTVVQVDGNTTTLTAPLDPELAVARVNLVPSPDGFHRITAEAPVVASVFARNGSPSPNSTLWFMAGANEPG